MDGYCYGGRLFWGLKEALGWDLSLAGDWVWVSF